MVESVVIVVILLIVFLRLRKKYNLKNKNKSKGQTGNNKKIKGEVVDIRQTTNRSKLESNRSAQRTNKPNQARDEWKRRSNRRKSR